MTINFLKWTIIIGLDHEWNHKMVKIYETKVP